MPGYSDLTRASSLPSSTTVKTSSARARCSKTSKKRCMSVSQTRSTPSPSTVSGADSRPPLVASLGRRSVNSVDGLSYSKPKLPNSR